MYGMMCFLFFFFFLFLSPSLALYINVFLHQCRGKTGSEEARQGLRILSGSTCAVRVAIGLVY